MPVDAIGGRRMAVGEALDQVTTLMRDPTSWVHAAVAGWERPASWEFLALADIFDVAAPHTYKNPKPYPRPMPEVEGRSEKFGAPIPPDQLGDFLRLFGRDPETLVNWPGYDQPETPASEPRVALNPHD